MVQTHKHIAIVGPVNDHRTAVYKELLENPDLRVYEPIHGTTQSVPPGEIPGMKRHYFFTHEFESYKDTLFVEWIQDENSDYHATLFGEIMYAEESGRPLIFDVGLARTLKLKEYFGNDLMVFFLNIKFDRNLSASTKELLSRKKACDFILSYEETEDPIAAVSSITSKAKIQLLNPQLV